MENKIENIVYSIKKTGYCILKNYYSKEECENIIKDTKNISQNIINNGEGNDLRITNFENI